MKLKGVLCTVLAAAMTVGSAVCANAADFSSADSTAAAGDVVSVPINVAPSSTETSTAVNAYAIAITYDSTMLEPVQQGTDDCNEAKYAVAGDNFSSGVLTADKNGDTQILVGWAAADPVTVTSETTLATVQFTVKSGVSGDANVSIGVAQVASSDADVTTSDATVEAAKGTVTVKTADKYTKGDVDGSGSVDILDARAITKHLAKVAVITDEAVLSRADTDDSGSVDILDAREITKWLAKVDSNLDKYIGKNA